MWARWLPISGQRLGLCCYQQWVKDQCPYIVAIVELDEQTGLRLTSNVLNCSVDDVAIGMRVTAGFVARHGVWYPVFVPSTAEAR